MIFFAWIRRAAAVTIVLGLCFASASAGAQSAPNTLRFIPQADLRSIDPIWTTAYVTRNFGYLVFDTLFALDKDFKPQPQMVDRWTVSDDELVEAIFNALDEFSGGHQTDDATVLVLRVR